MELLEQWVVDNFGLFASIILLGILTLVQITPIKVNPWSWIAKKVGRALNSEVHEDVKGIKEQLDDLEKKLDEEEYARVCSDVFVLRSQIIDAALALRRGEEFSLSKYQELIRVKDEYDRLVNKYGLVNNVLESEFDYIYFRYEEGTKNNELF